MMELLGDSSSLPQSTSVTNGVSRILVAYTVLAQHLAATILNDI